MHLEGLFIYLMVFSTTLILLESGIVTSSDIEGAGVSTFAAQKCSDGTVYGKCSLSKPLYCSNGVLVNNCTKCGCSGNKTCVTATNSCNTPPGVQSPAIISIDGEAESMR